MANTTFTTIAQIIANKLNSLIDRINLLSNQKADLSGADFTGDVSISGGTFTHNGLRYPDTDGSLGYGIVTDGNGNLTFQELSASSPSTIANNMTAVLLTDLFTGNGTVTNFTVNNTLTGILFVDINGVIQKQGVHYNISGDTVSFINPPSNSATIQVVYFGYGTNDNQIFATQVSNALNSDTFTGNGTQTDFITTNPIVRAVIVEINGITQLPITNYTTNSNTLSFASPVPNGDVITITYF